MRHITYILLLLLPLIGLSQRYEDEVLQYRSKQKEAFENDPYGPIRKENIGYLDYYPANAQYVVTAEVEMLFGEKPFRMPTYDGTSNPYQRYALLHFNIDGQPITLTAYQSVALFQNPAFANYLFLPFIDQTSGEVTYEGGRYLELDASSIQDGKIKIDFNKAYNPYCAYSTGYRCPQPPADNIIPVEIPVGEKKYKGPKNHRPVNIAMAKNFTEAEKSLILNGDKMSKMHIFQTTAPSELAVLKATSTDIKHDDPLIDILKSRMLATVNDPLHAGVGIAAPQVGINRNAIWVQRFDKDGEPFEFYINPKIIWRSKLTRIGTEGCLSIPDKRDEVARSYAIRLQYWDSQGKIIEENIEGFTAVIFQHEVDHLYGILFPDRLEEQTKDNKLPLNENLKFSISKGIRP